MGFLQGLTNVFQSFQEWQSKDEIIFGEVVRLMVDRGHPVINFDAEEGCQSARFLIEDDLFFSLRITLDKKVGTASVLNLTAEVRNKLSDPDDMIEMFRTDLMNIAKIPLFGQVKLNHEYNTVFGTVSSIKSLNSYLGKEVGDIQSTVLEKDLDEMIGRLREALKKFKKDL